MRQSCRQLTERNQFFVVEIAGRKVTGTVNHDVDKYRREFLAFSNHFRYVVAIYRDHLGRLFGHHISRRSNQPRIRHQTRNVPTAPLHDLPAPGPSIDVNAQVSCKYNMQSFDLHLDLTPGSLIPSGSRIIAERVLLMQFFQKHLSQTVQSVVSARKEPEGASTAYAGEAAEHVMIDVVARPS